MNSEQNQKDDQNLLIKNLSLLRQRIDRIRKNNKNATLWILVILLGLIFGHNIANLISNYVFLGRDEVSSYFFNFIYILILLIFFLKFCWYCIINYRISQTYVYWIISISIIYLFKIRNDDSSLLILLPFINNFLYFDIILVTGLLTILLSIRNQFGHWTFYYNYLRQIKKFPLTTKQKINPYLEDLPLDGEMINELDLFVENLIGNIIDFKPNQSFIIAIKAKWGYGKTTFLKRLEYKINNDERYEIPPIIFWFNTWKNQDEKSIVSNFFNLFKKELAVYNGNIESVINKYIGKLLSIVYAKEVRVLKTFTDDLIGEKGSIEEYYQKIENILTDLDRQIIIMVDDLDRLSKNEILETIRILRNVANFKNVIFVCGVDKEYLVKNAQFESNYLDKIFNLEIDLPSLSESNLFILLKQLINDSNILDSLPSKVLSIDGQKKDTPERINEVFDQIFYVDDSLMDLADLGINMSPDQQNSEQPELEEIFLVPSLFYSSRRDVKRFYNYIVTNLHILKKIDDIELYDYILFHILLFKYDWMKKNFEDGKFHIWIKGEINLQFSKNNFNKIDQPDNISNLDKNIIFSILIKLFPETNVIEGKNINQRRYFPIYLNNNIFNEAFSYIDLLDAHKKNSIAELIAKIDNEPQKNFILNDIKAFILKEENIRLLKDYKEVIELLNKDYFQGVSDIELLNFIEYGEENFSEEFKKIADEVIFINTENTFGDLLLKLNFHYATQPKDYNIHNFRGTNGIEEFFKKKNKQNLHEQERELKFVNKDYTINKLENLLVKAIENKASFEEINKIFSWCVEVSFKYFDFYYYPDRITTIIKEFIEKNISNILLDKEPEQLANAISNIYSYSYSYYAQIFANGEQKAILLKEAGGILENAKLNRTSFSENDLVTAKNIFLQNGFKNFIKFLKEIQLVGIENEKLKKLIELLESRII